VERYGFGGAVEDAHDGVDDGGLGLVVLVDPRRTHHQPTRDAFERFHHVDLNTIGGTHTHATAVA
jgi:hypothetical protein